LKQANISRLERRTDMLTSTARSYIEAIGGKLDILLNYQRERCISISLRRFLEINVHCNMLVRVIKSILIIWQKLHTAETFC